MKLLLTEPARHNYDALPHEIQTLANKQFDFLIKNIRHPSIRAKKYDEVRGIWQGRVDRRYRFYFLIQDQVFVILTIRKHPK